ncbi:MAG: release factor glutamine methyltransferase [Solirubrobacteraceae bacterium]|jgi:release factor glutamine methyltransferase|nr:release factor glutamine methyltransferase [Solirubrobacteraceae bacterium]
MRDTPAGLRLVTPPGVFRPISDTRLLARTARPLVPGHRVLELCTGSGAIAVDLARNGAREVVAVDLSRRAVATARFNARLNGAWVEVRHGDLLEAVAGERFDVIVSNPPYVPSADGGIPTRGLRRAWDAGADGRALLDRILTEAPRALNPGGHLLVVHSSICGERPTLDRLHAAGLDATVEARDTGPLGPLMRQRAEMLEARGLLEPGAREEEVLVIRGRLRDKAAAEAGQSELAERR